MGLDMYLYARKYVSKYDFSTTYEDRKPTEEFDSILSYAPEGLDKYGEFGGASINITVGYWRKANAIHQWFVDNIQDGIDDCREAYVTRDDLVELRDLCAQVSKVLPNGEHDEMYAEEVLPPQSGFFFGSTEIDEWYWQDIDKTHEMLNHILEVVPEDSWNWSFYYCSSW